MHIVVIASESLQRHQCSPSLAFDLRCVSSPLVLHLQVVLSKSRVARQARMAEGSVAMTAMTKADVWVVGLICDSFPRSLSGGLKILAGKPPAIVMTAFLLPKELVQKGEPPHHSMKKR